MSYGFFGFCWARSWVFFFFKQKTAYEMRISDWSSDVCSSDLKGGGPAGDEDGHPDAIAFRGNAVVSYLDPDEQEELSENAELVLGASKPFDPQEIGRASCRERVCQYV